ncbi:MAG: peptidoglycan DD-metalloendopeptidase family protein [Alphaproteobacteria bacterium]|nr:peptidoglycan DD-metalloendopeptidase family protein [Alphaproteobacteria bacterium]
MKRLYLLFLASCLLFVPSAYAARTGRDLAVVQSQIKQTEQRNKQIETQVKKSDRVIEQTQRDLVRAAERVNKLELERADLVTKISELDTEHEKLSKSIEQNRERLVQAASGILAMSKEPVFASDDAREYVLSSALLAGIADEFSAEMHAAARQIKNLEEVQEQKKMEQTKLDKTVKQYSVQRADLDKLLRTRTVQNEKLKSQQYELQTRLRELSARAQNLSELTAGLSRGEVPTDASFTKRKLRAPVSGRLVSAFGERTGLGLVSDGWRIRTLADALVTAPADGRVAFADNFRGHGRVLILAHKNSYYSVLAGLATADVLVDQEVLAGEPIGRMPGSRSEMYLELRRGARAIDPARIFNEPR